VSKLRSAIRYRQGFSPDSPAIGFLLTILSELTPKQQRDFCRFVTGSPSLPGGQITALNPPLTVVKIDLKTPLQETKENDPMAGALAGSGRSGQYAINLTESHAGSAAGHADAAAIAAAVASNYPLPSVMTCTHHLKLYPNYPTLEIMREKLMIAISEGNTGFTMS
jgi:E3 ubiquitin-protein ligase TRIP12